MAPEVSINLCCFNSEKYLRETLQSIIKQTYKDWELVIINDGSSDSTETIVYEFKNKGYPIIYKYQENKGLGASRNEALRLSQGKYIAFIDHDDVWLPEKIEKQAALFEKNLRVGLVFCDTLFFNQVGEIQQLYKREKPPRGNIFRVLLTDYFLSLETVMIRKNALESLSEWFDEELTIMEETDLFTRLAYQWEADYVDKPLAKWRVHDASLTWSKKELFPEEGEMILNKYTATIPCFQKNFADEIDLIKAKILRQRFMLEWEKGSRKIYRKSLLTYINKDRKLLVVYFMSFLPYRLFNFFSSRYKKMKGIVSPF